MLLRQLCVVILCGFAVSFSAATTAAPSERLTLFTEHFPPYSFMLNGEIRGINADIVREACFIAKLECELISLPWLRAFEQAQHHQYAGLFPTVRTPKRVNLFQWVGPLASSKAFLYRLKSRPEVNPTSLEDAKRFGIAVARGDVYEEYFMAQGFSHGINLLDFATKSEPVPLFLKGKVDLMVGSDLVMPDWLASHQQPSDIAEPVLDISMIGNNFLALNQQMPEHITQQLQQAIDELKRTGRFQAIIARYHDKPGQFSGSP